MANKKGKAICIFSAKGGVGKTIATLNMAGIFQLINKKVLIIDMDLAGGGISVALNKPFEKSVFNLSEDLGNNRYRDFEDYVTYYNEYIDFIAAPKDPRQATRMGYKYIDLIIEKATYAYDVVLIDTNHYLSDINLITLDRVDQILFLVTNEPLDLKNMKSLMSILHDLDINKYKMILNNSVNPYNDYFSLYDVKNILKTNIDYTLSDKFFVKNIDDYVIEGKIVTLDKKMTTTFGKDYTTLMTIATDLLTPVAKEGVLNEQK